MKAMQLMAASLLAMRSGKMTEAALLLSAAATDESAPEAVAKILSESQAEEKVDETADAHSDEMPMNKYPGMKNVKSSIGDLPQPEDTGGRQNVGEQFRINVEEHVGGRQVQEARMARVMANVWAASRRTVAQKHTDHKIPSPKKETLKVRKKGEDEHGGK